MVARAELFLVSRCRAGDERARNVLIERHLPLIRWCVQKYPAARPVEDYVHEVVLRLCRRLSLFDPDRSRLAGWIAAESKYAVVDRLRRSGSALIRVSRDVCRGRASGALPVVSLNARPPDAAGEDATIGDLLGTEDPRFDEVDRLDEAEAAIAGLSPREREVLRRMYGLDGCGPRLMHEVGAELGLTQSRISQLRGRALKRLGAARPA